MDLALYLEVQKTWSETVFGEGPRVEGVCKHIEKELKEVRANPTDVVEWVDIAILALDGAWRAGYTPHEVCSAMCKKQLINLKRKWHKTDGNEPAEHIKEQQ
jgi:hypothetical protein